MTGILLDDIRLDTDDELADRRDYWQRVLDQNAGKRNATALMSYFAAVEALVEIDAECKKRGKSNRMQTGT